MYILPERGCLDRASPQIAKCTPCQSAERIEAWGQILAPLRPLSSSYPDLVSHETRVCSASVVHLDLEATDEKESKGGKKTSSTPFPGRGIQKWFTSRHSHPHPFPLLSSISLVPCQTTVKGKDTPSSPDAVLDYHSLAALRASFPFSKTLPSTLERNQKQKQQKNNTQLQSRHVIQRNTGWGGQDRFNPTGKHKRYLRQALNRSCLHKTDRLSLDSRHRYCRHHAFSTLTHELPSRVPAVQGQAGQGKSRASLYIEEKEEEEEDNI